MSNLDKKNTISELKYVYSENNSLSIIFQLTLLNFLSLIYFTLPLIAFSSTILAYLGLIKGSEKIIINSVGISNVKITLPAIALYIFLGLFFITIINPLTAIFDERYSELEYRYIDRVDKFASITKNGLWLKQENQEKNLSSVLYAREIKEQGRYIIDFMILEYDEKGSFQGRLDGTSAVLNEMAYFEKSLKYQTNIKPEDIADSLSSPTNISIWRLLTFINFLEGLGYSAIDFKMHLYDLIFLPFFMASLALLASALVRKLKQNDRFTETIIYSLVTIFIIYFISNLLDALGSTSQLNPIISKASLPLIVTFFSILIYQKDSLKKIFQND